MDDSVENREPNEIASILSNIPELRHRADRAERILNALTETLCDIVFRMRADGGWFFCSERMSETTGISADSLLENEWTSQLHPDDKARVVSELNEALSSKTEFESHFRLSTMKGSYRRFIAKAKPVYNDTGDVIEWVGTASDVDDLVSAEEALNAASRESMNFVRKVTHDLRNAIAPIQNAVRVLQALAINESQCRRAIEIIDGQVKSLSILVDSIQQFTPINRRS